MIDVFTRSFTKKGHMYLIHFTAPLKDVHRAVQNGSLGHLNPTPWAVMTGNTLGWITYSYLLNVRCATDFAWYSVCQSHLTTLHLLAHQFYITRITSYSLQMHLDSYFPSGSTWRQPSFNTVSMSLWFYTAVWKFRFSSCTS